MYSMFHGTETTYTGTLLNDMTSISLPQVSMKTDYTRGLHDIRRSLQIITDPQTGLVFEIGIVNLSAADDWYDAEVSTFSWSLSTSDANALEFAENGALRPTKRRVYITSPGRGYSADLTKAELRHVRRTGTYIWKEEGVYQAIPTVRALERALSAANIRINRFSANSAGSNVATALMCAMPKNQITHAYFKGRPNIVKHNPLLLGLRMAIIENFVFEQINKRRTRDPHALTTQKIRQATDIIGNKQVLLKQSKAPDHLYTERLLNGLSYSHASARTDIQRALTQQPGVKLTLHFPTLDQLYRRQHDQLQLFTKELSRSGDVQGILLHGTHADHKYYPSLRWAVEEYALTR